ncbi:MAG TPA: sodium-dependent bicarbonate transport family permease, partial [Pirellulales bacterium]|nr:sodium-dependent bicarbonate transport family permease [Pirellulales bacterium]
LASGIPYAAYMPVMLAVMEIPGCLVALFLVSRLRHQGMDALGNMKDEPNYDPQAVAEPRGDAGGEHGGHAASGGHAPAGKSTGSMFNLQLMHEVFFNPGLFLLFGGIVIGFASELQRKHEEVAVVEIESRGDVHTIKVAKEGEKLPELNGKEHNISLDTLVANAAAEPAPAAKSGKPRPSIFVLPLQKAQEVAKKVEPKKKDPMGQLDMMYVDLFQGALCLFLLEMGMTACRRLRDLKSGGWQFVLFGVLAPNVFAVFGMCVAHLYSHALGEAFDQGTYVLFAVLCAAASYIAVPAVQRMAIPEASPTLPLAASLGLTFSYNVTIGIPTYIVISELLMKQFPVL